MRSIRVARSHLTPKINTLTQSEPSLEILILNLDDRDGINITDKIFKEAFKFFQFHQAVGQQIKTYIDVKNKVFEGLGQYDLIFYHNTKTNKNWLFKSLQVSNARVVPLPDVSAIADKHKHHFFVKHVVELLRAEPRFHNLFITLSKAAYWNRLDNKTRMKKVARRAIDETRNTKPRHAERTETYHTPIRIMTSLPDHQTFEPQNRDTHQFKYTANNLPTSRLSRRKSVYNNRPLMNTIITSLQESVPNVAIPYSSALTLPVPPDIEQSIPKAKPSPTETIPNVSNPNPSATILPGTPDMEQHAHKPNLSPKKKINLEELGDVIAWRETNNKWLIHTQGLINQFYKDHGQETGFKHRLLKIKNFLDWIKDPAHHLENYMKTMTFKDLGIAKQWIDETIKDLIKEIPKPSTRLKR